MKIFNRWGTLIFETTDNFKWNGKLLSGELASDGVYFYTLVYSRNDDLNLDLILQGSVTLIN